MSITNSRGIEGEDIRRGRGKGGDGEVFFLSSYLCRIGITGFAGFPIGEARASFPFCYNTGPAGLIFIVR